MVNFGRFQLTPVRMRRGCIGSKGGEDAVHWEHELSNFPNYVMNSYSIYTAVWYRFIGMGIKSVFFNDLNSQCYVTRNCVSAIWRLFIKRISYARITYSVYIVIGNHEMLCNFAKYIKPLLLQVYLGKLSSNYWFNLLFSERVKFK
jgi:hypothetical protein